MLKSEMGDYALSLKNCIKLITKKDEKVFDCTPLLDIINSLDNVIEVENTVIYKDDLTETKFVEKVWQRIYVEHYNSPAILIDSPYVEPTYRDVNNVNNFFIKIAKIFERTYKKYNSLLIKAEEAEKNNDDFFAGHQSTTEHTVTRTRNKKPFNVQSITDGVVDTQTYNKGGITTSSNVNILEKLQHYNLTYEDYMDKWVHEFDSLFQVLYNYEEVEIDD